MKITRLICENFKRLEAVEIEISAEDGNMVVITGKNGAGKSSVLDAIQCLFGGGEVLPKRPIRRGAEVGRVQCETGEIIVTRKFTAGGSNLTLEAASGARFRSPQHMLDELYAALAFDPVEFGRMKPAKRREILRSLTKIEVDIDALDGANARDYETRTDVNREARRLRGQASGIQYPEDLPAAPVDITALTEALRQAGDDNALLERRKAKRERAAQEAHLDRQTAWQRRERAEQLRREAEDLDRTAAELEAHAAELDREIAEALPLPEPADTARLVADLEVARTTNAHLEARARRETLEAEAAALEERAQGLTATMAARTAQKDEAIAKAVMPVKGMGYLDGDDDVTLNGVPFDQASQAEKIRAGVELAMAANPKLRVVLVRDGSLLDRDSWQLLSQLADQYDFQAWVEVTDDDAKTGIIIEDGMVRRPDPPRTEQAALALLDV
jgi:AAA domain